MLTIDVVTTVPAFKALESEWNDLASMFPTPLHQFEWFAASLEAFGPNKKLAVFVARANGAARAIAPLLIETTLGLPRLVILGNETAEPNAFIYSEQAALGALADGIVQSGLPIWLRRLNVDSVELEQLTGNHRKGGSLFTNRANTATAHVTFRTDWKAIEANMSPSSRTFLRRKRKLAEREGQLELEVLSPTPATVDDQLREVFRVEASGWKGRRGTAILSDPQLHSFYLNYGRRAAALGILRLFFLRIGPAIAAVRMAVEHSHRLWELKIGYDERWARCSPGVLLTHETLRHACEQGLEGFEFLGRAEKWQCHWPVELRTFSAVRFYPLNIRGALLLSYDLCARIERNALRKFRKLDSRFIVSGVSRTRPDS
jgi:CelD/BcsL family acetyltransferase involved in cellulose biosynthesis